jgi:ABC-type dipeptide/oligopeptide/nickel transport system permease component
MLVTKYLFFFGPLFFGFAFLAPLIAQIVQRLDLSSPFALSPLQFGLIVGGVLGLIATYRGKWI